MGTDGSYTPKYTKVSKLHEFAHYGMFGGLIGAFGQIQKATNNNELVWAIIFTVLMFVVFLALSFNTVLVKKE